MSEVPLYALGITTFVVAQRFPHTAAFVDSALRGSTGLLQSIEIVPLSDLLKAYRSTSLIRKRRPVGPYSRTMPRLLW